MNKRLENKANNLKVGVLIFFSIIILIIIQLKSYSKDVSLWSQVFTDTTFILLYTILFCISIIVMIFFMYRGCCSNGRIMAFKYYLGITIPSLAVAILTQQVIFYTIFYDETQLFFSLQSVLIPLAIAGVLHLLTTIMLLHWYQKVTFKEGLRIGFISTIIPLIILMLLMGAASNLVGLSSI